MKSMRNIALGAAAILLVSGLCMAATETDGQKAAKVVIDKVTKDAIAILRDKSNTQPQRHEKIRSLANEAVDATTMAKLSLGKPWRNLNDDQKKAFIDEFKKYVSATYSHTMDEYTDEEVKLTSTRQESDGDVTVLSQIVGTLDSGARGEVAKVDYRLRKVGDAWKIIDLNIDGVSLVSNFRSQFQDIISNGSFDQLMKLLKDKNASSEKK